MSTSGSSPVAPQFNAQPTNGNSAPFIGPLNESASAAWKAAQEDRTVDQEVEEDLARMAQIATNEAVAAYDERENQEVMDDTEMPLAAPLAALTILSPQEVVKKVSDEREALAAAMREILSTGAGTTEDTNRCYEMSLEIEKKNSIIQSLTSCLDPKPSVFRKGAEASKWATSSMENQGLSLNREDLPRLQLTGKTYAQFENKRVFKNIDDFIKTFEEVIVSANHKVNLVWKKYIPISLADDLKAWMRKELLVCESWDAAKIVLEKKFGNRQMRVLATKELISMSLRMDETISDFDNRFTRIVEESEYKIEDQIMADIYFLALPLSWQTNVMTVVNAQQKENVPWTAEDVYRATLNVFSDRTPTSEMQESHKRKAQELNDQHRAPKKRNNQGTKYYCKYHGDNNSHDDSTCKYNSKSNGSGSARNSEGSMPSRGFLGSQNRPKPATSFVPCTYCKRKWSHGHRCREYLEQNGDKKVLSTSVDRKGKQADRSSSSQDMENSSYNCKQTNENVFNPYKSLITPLILNNRKLKGKVDTGSDITCINKFILDNVFPEIKINKVKGNLNFLSKSSKRLGQTEPMKIRYLNDISFTFCFEVVEFHDTLETEFDILLGTDILPKLNIGLTNVAHKYPDDEDSEDIQFENANHDPSDKYDPENADYGTAEERKTFMKYIQSSLDKNAAIQPGQFCNIPESIVKIPIKKDATNCYIRQYPLPYHARPEIKKQLAEWLSSGVVVESKPSNKYNSPLLAIGKKDENNNLTKTRICLDLRRQNMNIDDSLVEDFAVPNIQDIFDKVSTGVVFSRLDLKSAYNSFKVDEASQEVLSFMFDDKTYKWVGTCFGLKFVTSQFCRVMNIIFRGEAQIATYVDDCCIFSDVKNHAKIVKRAIDKLTAANLKINYEKCTFFKSSIYMLGFVIGPGITKIDQRRLSNINEWPIPESAEQVRKIMGVVSYLRNYVPKISDIAAPLDALRNDKDVKNKWTQAHTDRLQNIKQILMSKAILHTPRMEDKMYLETDASQYAASAVLTQRDDKGRTLIIAMASTSLPPAAQNWSVNRRELFAIYYGFQRFRSLLLGHPKIEVWTDHRAITFYYTTHVPNRTIQSYMDVLNQFSFTVTYIKGINNVLPDLLSRLYPPLDNQEELDEEEKKIKQLNRIILERRKRNPVESFKSTDKINSTDKFIYKRNIKSSDPKLNVLALKLGSSQYKESSTDYIAPPVEERHQLLVEAHKLGHFGTESMVQRLHEEGLHWTGIFTEAKEIVSACVDCARHNIVKKGYHPLKSIVAAEPFAHIATDMAGPFSVTSNGNIYILIVVDICTRYIIARALPNKQSDTVANVLCQIFGDYGLPNVAIAQDNGREYRNTLMALVTKTLGIPQRFSTPYYPQSNGCAENAVKTIVNTVRKMCGNDTSRWDMILPAAQLCCNLKIRNRTGSTPFSLMFARQFPQIQDRINSSNKPAFPKKVMTVEDLVKKAEYMATIVFPAIHQRTKELTELQRKRFDKHHYLIDIPLGTTVMVRLPSRASKLSPLYEGPFTVVTKTKAGTYVLKDEMNEMLHRDYVPSELKIVTIDESAIEDKLYEVKEIRMHRGPVNNREYLVNWVGYGERENSWLNAEAFSDPETIRKYWVKVNEKKQSERLKNNSVNDGSKKRQRSPMSKTLRNKDEVEIIPSSKQRKRDNNTVSSPRQRVLRSKKRKN